MCTRNVARVEHVVSSRSYFPNAGSVVLYFVHILICMLPHDTDRLIVFKTSFVVGMSDYLMWFDSLAILELYIRYIVCCKFC